MNNQYPPLQKYMPTQQQSYFSGQHYLIKENKNYILAPAIAYCNGPRYEFYNIPNIIKYSEYKRLESLYLNIDEVRKINWLIRGRKVLYPLVKEDKIYDLYEKGIKITVCIPKAFLKGVPSIYERNVDIANKTDIKEFISKYKNGDDLNGVYSIEIVEGWKRKKNYTSFDPSKQYKVLI